MNTLALCIPAYNAEAYLPRLLQSAKRQLIPFDEILVYNDCSTDATAYVAEMNGAKVVNGDVNRGCSYAKNQLAAVTSCNWVHFHDADDELLPNFTSLAQKWLNKANCPDIVLFDYEHRDNKTHALFGIRHFNTEQLESDPVAYAILEQINPFCGLYNKQLFLKAGGYDIDPLILYNEDSAFHIKMAIKGLTFSSENEVSIINYRINNSMSSSNLNKCLEAQYYVLKNAVALKPDYSELIAFRLWNLAGHLAEKNNWEYVKKTLTICEQIGYSHPTNGSKIFLGLTKLNPFFAVWFREKMIRFLKPHLRRYEF
jgi:glycosyltransferase involved in cell wall biosynthesis